MQVRAKTTEAAKLTNLTVYSRDGKNWVSEAYVNNALTDLKDEGITYDYAVFTAAKTVIDESKKTKKEKK